MTVVDTANICLLTDSENKILSSRQIVNKAIDVITSNGSSTSTKFHLNGNKAEVALQRCV